MNFDIAFGLSRSLSFAGFAQDVQFDFSWSSCKRKKTNKNNRNARERERRKKPTEIIVKDDHWLDYVHSTK